VKIWQKVLEGGGLIFDSHCIIIINWLFVYSNSSSGSIW